MYLYASRRTPTQQQMHQHTPCTNATTPDNGALQALSSLLQAARSPEVSSCMQVEPELNT